MSQVNNEGNPIDLGKLKQMIHEGLEAIPYDHKTPQAILMIGDTGVGKSTIMSYLSGNSLKVIYGGLKPKIDNLGESSIVIGHKQTSQTSVPTRVEIHNLAFYDCPGFKDNQGEERQISNSFFVQKLLDMYKQVKLVLIVDESHITEPRAQKLPKLIRNLRRSFKTFEDIKEGVCMIINRAAPDHSVEDYHKQIRKMIQLKNQTGFLFNEEERLFIDYLMFKKRVLLFRQAGHNNDTKFEAGQCERQIIPTIDKMQYVKSKHIENILSESAKLAIRDFIDQITARSNLKIELICAQIIEMYTERVHSLGRDISGIINIKDEVIKLAEKIKSCKKEEILPILQTELPKDKLQDFEEDFASVLFFKTIYDKTNAYFSNLVNKIYAELSHLLTLLDKRITVFQKEEQAEKVRVQEVKQQKIREEKRQEEKKIAIEHCDKMDGLKTIAQNLIAEKKSFFEQIKAAMNSLSGVQQEIQRLKGDAQSLNRIDKDIKRDFETIETTFFQRRSVR